MSLPIGFIRKDDKKFEEITIPATASSVGDIGRQLVPIADLDIIGQTAFQVQLKFPNQNFESKKEMHDNFDFNIKNQHSCLI